MTEAIKFIQKNGIECATEIVNENKGKLKIFSTFEMDLKRIVESHDFVDLYGGVDHLKEFIRLNGYTDTPFGEQAFKHIADVEACQ